MSFFRVPGVSRSARHTDGMEVRILRERVTVFCAAAGRAISPIRREEAETLPPDTEPLVYHQCIYGVSLVFQRALRRIFTGARFLYSTATIKNAPPLVGDAALGVPRSPCVALHPPQLHRPKIANGLICTDRRGRWQSPRDSRVITLSAPPLKDDPVSKRQS
jgi:hypothetical protein